VFEGVIAREGGPCGSSGNRWTVEAIEQLALQDDRIRVITDPDTAWGRIIAVVRMPHSEIEGFLALKKKLEAANLKKETPLESKPVVPVRCEHCGVSKCPRCGDPIVARSGADLLGKLFSGLVCGRCGGLWDNPGDPS